MLYAQYICLFVALSLFVGCNKQIDNSAKIAKLKAELQQLEKRKADWRKEVKIIDEISIQHVKIQRHLAAPRSVTQLSCEITNNSRSVVTGLFMTLEYEEKATPGKRSRVGCYAKLKNELKPGQSLKQEILVDQLISAVGDSLKLSIRQIDGVNKKVLAQALDEALFDQDIARCKAELESLEN